MVKIISFLHTGSVTQLIFCSVDTMVPFPPDKAAAEQICKLAYIQSFRSHYAPGVDSASNRNKC
jgi:hypothetical protein